MANKIVFITGANRGLGKVIMKKFVENGYDIIAHSRKYSQEFNEYINNLVCEYNVRIYPIFFDLLDSSSMKICIKELFSKKIYPDILINNAGVAHGGLFQATSINTIRDIFNINLFSQMELTQLIIKIFMRKKSGIIINIGSVLGLDIKAGSCAYGLSKAGIMLWTKTLATELSAYNIRVNAVAPGLLETEMALQMEENAKETMLASCSMHRLGKPEEVADLIYYLSSDESSFITGQVIRIDGGMC